MRAPACTKLSLLKIVGSRAPSAHPVPACHIFSFALALISPDQRRMIYHYMVWIGGCVMRKPGVVLIGADKGGVGKTVVGRALLDYFAHRRLCARAFDTEVPRGTLKRFHPNVTDVVDINYVPDQMRIFDTVNSTDATVSL